MCTNLNVLKELRIPLGDRMCSKNWSPERLQNELRVLTAYRQLLKGEMMTFNHETRSNKERACWPCSKQITLFCTYKGRSTKTANITAGISSEP